jgi:hypothetical protein
MAGLSYKYKTYLLCGVFVLLGYLLYKKVFSATILLAKTGYALDEQLQKQQQDDTESKALEAQLKNYDHILLADSLDTDPGRALLNFLSLNNEDQLVLEDFSPPLVHSVGQYQVHTHRVKLEGDYISLLKMVNRVEQQYKGGNLSSVSFVTTEKINSGEKKLYAELYMQHIAHR